jgi:hypothetical protein
MALRDLHVADVVVRYREVALPAGVARIGLRPLINDCEPAAIGYQRSGKVALRNLHAANLVVCH